MKTQTSYSNLKRIALAFLTLLVVSAGTFAQPVQDKMGAEYAASLARLETLMHATAQAIRYTAPAYNESADIAYELEWLDAKAEETEASLLYKASDFVAVEEVNEAVENLETLFANIEASLRYKAPVNPYEEKFLPGEEQLNPYEESLRELLANTEASLKYKAPDADELFLQETQENNSEPMLAETF
ncbi:MAG: hypothetical protein JXQ80_06750 [Bacteroidales bacterium]|nr:hypothetical protein [Bacteroidales bacterium]